MHGEVSLEASDARALADLCEVFTDPGDPGAAAFVIVGTGEGAARMVTLQAAQDASTLAADMEAQIHLWLDEGDLFFYDEDEQECIYVRPVPKPSVAHNGCRYVGSLVEYARRKR